MTDKKQAVSITDRVAASRARAIAGGARKMPSGILHAEAARALQDLIDRGYASSATACIARALIDAARR